MSDVETKLSRTFSINFRFEDPGDYVPHRRAQLLGTLLALALPGFELDQNMFPSLVGASAVASDDVPESKLKEAAAQILRALLTADVGHLWSAGLLTNADNSPFLNIVEALLNLVEKRLSPAGLAAKIRVD